MSPITPREVAGKKLTLIPAAVFEAFDALIVEKFNGSYAVVLQDEVIARVKESTDGFKIEWLNVEAAYEEAGWIVEYNKPGYCETYPATFTFKCATRKL